MVAANRDEFYAREWDGPLVLDPTSASFGGRDTKGGSWMGVNKYGLFVGLTNQRSALAAPPNARSRGEIVTNVLKLSSIDQAADHVDTVHFAQYPEFNLVVGDGERLFVAYIRANGVQISWLNPGIHVLANDRLLSPMFPKTSVFADQITMYAAEPWELLCATLQRTLGNHQLPPEHLLIEDPHSPIPPMLAKQLQALCIHTPLYGTRSSTIVTISHRKIRDYLFASGSPCVSLFRDYSAQLG